MSEIPAKGTASVWWLGQGGFVFEGAETGPLVVDPYLSDSVAKQGGSKRLHPVPVAPLTSIARGLTASGAATRAVVALEPDATGRHLVVTAASPPG